MPDIDQQWMERALQQAEKSVGLAAPNPAVGCVLVRGDDVVGEGVGEHVEVAELCRSGLVLGRRLCGGGGTYSNRYMPPLHTRPQQFTQLPRLRCPMTQITILPFLIRCM